ncbi:MAG: precorrin-6y C5,15-methyltransferase (decarboxylating) subunit CbiE [Muribaculaceae bacterium]|nr:precorrin-6y C5,15-methyltransferase (decarboxylating) subunit CbiE [Muribaculaceae bacterium]
MSEKQFIVIGLSDSRSQWFTPEVRELIASGHVFSGGRRHHEIVKDLLPEGCVWIDIVVPLEKVWVEYSHYSKIVVFASGDPLFYGFAATLSREFPDCRMKVYPAFNSLQMLAHRMLVPYADMVNISVTGRPWKGLDSAVIRQCPLIGVLTDHKKGPAEIAGRLLEYGYDNYMMTVGENLGNESEELVRSFSLEEAYGKTFSHPNCVILTKKYSRKRYFGIPESEFYHLEGRRNMITKMPIRLLTLSMLDLYERHTLWDIGFCTGSVSIEAKLQFPSLEVVAFERREESRELLVKNCRKFGAPGITGVIGDFMNCDISRYPSPDAVFIGGHGGRLEEMVCRIYKVLNKGGVLVFNSVSAESCHVFRNAVEACGGVIEAEHILILDDHNPITILKAK